MLHPDSKLVIVKDAVILVATLFIAIEIPLIIVLQIEENIAFKIINWLITVFFLGDIIINFNISISIKGKLITDRTQIAFKYLKTWFAVDLISALPFGLMFGATALLTVSRLIKLFRLIRLVKLVRVTGSLQKSSTINLNPAIFRLVIIVGWIVIVAHFIACLWILISQPDASIDKATQYIRSLYWTITTLTTIGYGDIVPKTNFETIFVIFIELIGAGMYGLIIANIANLITNIDIAKTQFKEKLKRVNIFLNYRNIPAGVKRKINSYFDYLWESRRGYDEAEILNDLPIQMKESVSFFLNKGVIEKVPIFRGATDEFIKEIVLNLIPDIYTPGDDIVVAGEMGDDMYFVSKGVVDVLSADGKICFATLVSGQFFGEIALLLRTPRTATIRAKEYCDLYRLEKETFEQILKKYPDFESTIRELAKKRKEETETKKEEESGTLAKVRQIEAVKSGKNISIKWSECKNAKNYEIMKENPDASIWSVIAKGLSLPLYVDVNIEAGIEHSYKVRAHFNTGPGPWSDIITVGIENTNKTD